MKNKQLLLVLGLIVLIGLAFFVGKKFSPSVAPEVTMVPGEIKVASTQALTVLWQEPVRINDISAFALPDALVKPTLKPIAEGEFYVVGMVEGGLYDGAEYLLVFLAPEGLGTRLVYRMLRKDDTMVIIGQDNEVPTAQSLEYYGFATSVSTDASLFASGLALPDTIEDTVHHQTLALTGLPFFYGQTFFNSHGLKFVFNDPVVGAVYTSGAGSITNNLFTRNGFYVKRPDGLTAIYDLVIPFMNQETLIPDITWSSGPANVEEYVAYTRGGCGGSDYLAVTPYLMDTDLVAIGITGTGATVYTYKDANHSVLKQMYDETYKGPDSTLTYETFIAGRPIFFWKDNMGRYIKFQNVRFGPSAECGKPVIYLYPEVETKVRVEVTPQGGFSKTIPAYGSGWNVIAKPNGEILNVADKVIYPYLFWEGRGGQYQTPDKGWVVRQEDLHDFLVSKLASLGLNAQESKDFMEFWEPKMAGSPYYFVTFMGNTTMNYIAPLTITPKPDTVIRILMDYLPLEKPIAVSPFTIHTPERKGFTVVEWGGVLR